MSNILIKINYTFINKYTEKKLTKNKLERNSNYFSKKELDIHIKENETSFINGIRYYNEEEKKIILELKEILDNIKNVENEKSLQN